MLTQNIKTATAQAIKDLYQIDVEANSILINATKPEFEGDYTVVMFAFVKQLNKSPEVLGAEIGERLVANNPTLFSSFNVIKGFLNLVVADSYWINFLQENYNNAKFGLNENAEQKVMVEYASPNTNKPLHLGHLRNIFLGWSIAEISKANGYNTTKTCIVNDRGIHICKSMIAWKLYANGATPQTTNTKGDHFVGDYYVKFNDVLKSQSKSIYQNLVVNSFDNYRIDDEQIRKIQIANEKIGSFETAFEGAIKSLDIISINKIGNPFKLLVEESLLGNSNWKSIQKGFSDLEFKLLSEKEIEQKKKKLNTLLKDVLALEDKIEKEKEFIKDIADNLTEIMKLAKQMLIDWEAGNPEIMQLWKEMNSWVYEGFDATYKTIGADFDKTYYESNTYLLGKKIVQEGLQKNVFVQDEDNSVWIDLTNDGLDRKIVQRKDGTSVYITQDIGLAEQRYNEYNADKSIYVIGDEQNYHMKVLKLICQKLQLPSADGIEHLSYGMVELPTGKMKSREGTVVDADDIVAEMINIAKQRTEELGKVKDFTEQELQQLYTTLGLGALKFFLLRVDPKKKMIFNPEESIDFHGFTGPFVQYTHARIKSVLRKLENENYNKNSSSTLLELEKDLIICLEQFSSVIKEASTENDPSKIAIYVFELAKTFNSFYTEHSIANAENEEKKILRLQLSQLTSNTIKTGMSLLGIVVPERM